MRTRSWSLAAGFLLAGLIASGPVAADVSWSGTGWYVEGSVSGMDIELMSGPYSSQADCEAAQPADTDTYHYVCSYETSDPTDDGPPRRRLVP